MCIHSEKELKRLLRFYDPNRVSAVILRDGDTGRFIGGWQCTPSDAGKIASIVKKLKEWHPLFHPVADLSIVNTARLRLGLPKLDSDGLPISKKLPLPPPDNDRDVVARWVRAAQDVALRELRLQRTLA